MKKYISPEMIIVQLHTTQMLAESVTVYDDEELTDQNEILTKGVVNNKSIWESEW